MPLFKEYDVRAEAEKRQNRNQKHQLWGEEHSGSAFQTSQLNVKTQYPVVHKGRSDGNTPPSGQFDKWCIDGFPRSCG